MPLRAANRASVIFPHVGDLWAAGGARPAIVDLNLVYGTDTSYSPGPGVWTNPQFANDGNNATFASLSADTGGNNGIQADLGAVSVITGPITMRGANFGDDKPLAVYASPDGSAWTQIDPFGTWALVAGVWVLSLASPIYGCRYARVWEGNSSGSKVNTWEIYGYRP